MLHIVVITTFVPENMPIKMKKIPIILLLMAMMLTLTSHTPMGGGVSTTYYSNADTTNVTKDTIKPSNTAPQDTSVAYTDTLGEVSVKADKSLRVVDIINKSLNNGIVQPKQKGISDIIGEKANDYIMHPFAWRERRKEKNLKKAKENIKKLDAAKTYEDELTEAIYRQLREDSIANAKKEQK